MAVSITLLAKFLPTQSAFERSQASMRPHMVFHVAQFVEGLRAQLAL